VSPPDCASRSDADPFHVELDADARPGRLLPLLVRLLLAQENSRRSQEGGTR
jgi:hypothetical protein